MTLVTNHFCLYWWWWVVICKELTKIQSKRLRHCKILMFSIFLCKKEICYSCIVHIVILPGKLISWCCCNYFVQCTEIQSMSENQTTSVEVVLYRIPILFSASNHMVYTACMLKGPFPFVQKNHFSSKFIWKEIALDCLLLQGI